MRNLFLLPLAIGALSFAACGDDISGTPNVEVPGGGVEEEKPVFGTYVTGDFHQHTGYSDGTNPIKFVYSQALKYGLDFSVNSEHGGAFGGDASEGEFEGACPKWSATTPLKGDANGRNMWRWQSIKEYSWLQTKAFGDTHKNIITMQGLEWNPAGHEHASTCIISGQFGGEEAKRNADAMAQFEYMFDNNDADKTGGNAFGWVKSSKTGHEKSMEAAKWLQDNHRKSSWIVPAHPERQNKWSIADYRDLNDIAPDVFVAFESTPGHQASTNRGGIGNSTSYKKSYTFGGTGIMAAQVGGLWDAMLSEGRGFWLVANSDFHQHVTQGDGDFYPGEYQKNYISVKEKSAQGIVDGLRSGNLFTVHGDLIDKLEFSIGTATMGQTYLARTNKVKIKIVVRDPETKNHNQYTSLTNPKLNHIDLIAGEMRSKLSKSSPEYSVDTYDKTHVIARFDAVGGVTDANGIVSRKWAEQADGVKTVEYEVELPKDTYFRLRGTNHGLNATGETDANGNPLVDAPAANVTAGAKAAFEDLWFYSNPVFVKK